MLFVFDVHPLAITDKNIVFGEYIANYERVRNIPFFDCFIYSANVCCVFMVVSSVVSHDNE